MLTQPFVFAALVLMAFIAVCAFAMSVRPVAKVSPGLHPSPDPPWRHPRLWEFLVRTACPVRGPALRMA